jgi:hypothetical protein
MVASNYARGRGIAPLVTEGTAQESADVQKASHRSFSQMIDRFTFHFVAFGVEPSAARTLADAVITGIEGAMVMARALRGPALYDSMRAVLVSHAATVSAKPSARKRG